MPTLPNVRLINWYMFTAARTNRTYNSDGSIEYEAAHRQAGVSDSDVEWWISKYVYDTSGNCIKEELLQGAWSNRASLSWSI